MKGEKDFGRERMCSEVRPKRMDSRCLMLRIKRRYNAQRERRTSREGIDQGMLKKSDSLSIKKCRVDEVVEE